MRDGPKDKADGIVALARETADALGRLTKQHLHLARLEMRADLRAMGREAGLIAVLAALAIVGYALAMVGVSMIIGDGWQRGVPFLIIGAVHVLASGVGILIAVARLRRMRPMNATADEVSRSLEPLGISQNGTSARPSRTDELEKSQAKSQEKIQ
jgi:Putative Actinobacterial Holin-X, holin superfamily III